MIVKKERMNERNFRFPTANRSFSVLCSADNITNGWRMKDNLAEIMEMHRYGNLMASTPFRFGVRL